MSNFRVPPNLNIQTPDRATRDIQTWTQRLSKNLNILATEHSAMYRYISQMAFAIPKAMVIHQAENILWGYGFRSITLQGNSQLTCTLDTPMASTTYGVISQITGADTSFSPGVVWMPYTESSRTNRMFKLRYRFTDPTTEGVLDCTTYTMITMVFGES